MADYLQGGVWNTRGEPLGMAGGWVAEMPDRFPPQMVKVVIDGVEREMTVEEFQAQRDEINRRAAGEDAPPSRATSHGGHAAILARANEAPPQNLAYVPGPGGSFEVVVVDDSGDDKPVGDRPVPEHLVLNRWEIEARHREQDAAAEATPASKGDVGRLEQTITQLKAKLSALGGRP